MKINHTKFFLDTTCLTLNFCNGEVWFKLLIRIWLGNDEMDEITKDKLMKLLVYCANI